MRLLILAIVALTLGLGSANANQRIALVIGNSAYARIGALANPAADARLIAQTLETLGFETDLILDADQSEMKRSIADFGRRLRVAEQDAVGLFYFAGHGIQADGRNFLIPVEAAPADPADLDLEGVDANWALRQMESAGNRTNIMILDACRNNPFTARHRSMSRGLARVDAPTGSFLAYATAPGDTADDGDGANSPFTRALVDLLPSPGKPIEQIFKQVRIEVIRATGGKQTPWDSSSLVGDFYFNEAAEQEAPKPVELSLWQSVSKSGDAGRLALFLQVYPNSKFAPEAQLLLAEAIARDPALVIQSGSGPETADAPSNAPAPGKAVSGAPAPPALSEHEMIALAQTSRSASDYQNYLIAYPDGVFADLARAEIANLADPAQAGSAKSAEPQATAETETASLFDRPLSDGPPSVTGRTLHELARSFPAYPPVDGLDESLWREQNCSNCHNWTRENLCRQGKFYLETDPSSVERIPHPFGGSFKTALLQWATDGCR